MTPLEPLAGLEPLRRNWGWLLALGILLIVAGTLALGVPWLMTLTSVFFFGCLLLATGIVTAVNAFSARHWSGFFLLVLAAVLEIVVGCFVVAHPEQAALELTLVLAAFLLIGGIFRIAAALAHRFPFWGWVLFDGIVSVILGLMLWRQWPASGIWFIGFCVGLDMLFRGWSWVVLALAVRKAPSVSV